MTVPPFHLRSRAIKSGMAAPDSDHRMPDRQSEEREPAMVGYQSEAAFQRVFRQHMGPDTRALATVRRESINSVWLD